MLRRDAGERRPVVVAVPAGDAREEVVADEAPSASIADAIRKFPASFTTFAAAGSVPATKTPCDTASNAVRRRSMAAGAPRGDPCQPETAEVNRAGRGRAWAPAGPRSGQGAANPLRVGGSPTRHPWRDTR